MRYVSAGVAFFVVFACAFVLGGWFLMPHLPPTPDHFVNVFDLEYWTDNWAGALLGIALGAMSARSTFMHKRRAVAATAAV
jgi:uncharacterized membrane protein AbrB (regulator of aidB expression)